MTVPRRILAGPALTLTRIAAILLAVSLVVCATSSRTADGWCRATVVASERGDGENDYLITVRWDDARGVHQQRRVAVREREYVLFVRGSRELCVLETSFELKMEPCRS
jgi:hypothetical protein